jgi:hypothetical protein
VGSSGSDIGGLDRQPGRGLSRIGTAAGGSVTPPEIRQPPLTGPDPVRVG